MIVITSPHIGLVHDTCELMLVAVRELVGLCSGVDVGWWLFPS
jgi:hypothetical protein